MRHLHRYLAAGTASMVAVLTVLCCSPGLTVASAAGAQAPTTSAFNQGQVRAAEDPAVVAHGKALYGINCQACHGSDLRGGDMGGPNLLRSQIALTDKHGELIVPIIQGARAAQGMPNLGLNDEDAGAVAAYVRSVISTIGGQGAPPGQKKVLDIVVGDAGRGQAYFAAHCSSCHSPTGDLKGIATTFHEPVQLQARWITGGAGGAQASPATKPTVDVTVAPGEKDSGELVRMDDFLVTLRRSDGTERSFTRKGAAPVVVVHDPMQAHREMLSHYTDGDIHDVTAYLVTLK
ncbi:MAG: c-type cytochrome [Acidobacteria bacterium]|nr:c-type cytochrome [Acidobacteriota bacterium]